MESEKVDIVQVEGFTDLEADNAKPLKLAKNGLPLVPQPMDDAHDPLNWSVTQKVIIHVVVGLYTFLGTIHMSIIAPAFFVISDELNVAFALTTYLIGAPVLAYGFGSVFWVGFGNYCGARMAFFISSLAAGLLCIWSAKAGSFGSLIAARTLASFNYSSPQPLGPQVVGDILFLKDRAKGVTFMVVSQALGFCIGPLIGGYIVQDIGWRWTMWIVCIATLASCIAILLLVPETQYTSDPDKFADHRTTAEHFKFWRVSGGGQPKVSNLGRAFGYCFRYGRHPVVVMITCSFALSLCVNNYITSSQSISFPEKYGFSTGATGLTYIGNTLGTIFGLIFGGPINDWHITWKRRKLAKTNREYQPETRFVSLIFSCIIGMAGCILFGTCTQNSHQCNYMGSVIGSFGIIFSFVALNGITFSYLVDVYLGRTDTTLVIVHGFGNLASFGMTYAIVPWNTNSGYAVSFGVLSVVVFLAHFILFVLWWKGLAIRHWTAERFVEARANHHGENF